MHLKQIMKRTVALVLALTLLLSLCACDKDSANQTAANIADAIGIPMEAKPGLRLIDSAWINSDLKGSIDENTDLDLKDDFHTTVNRDWILENNVNDNITRDAWDVMTNTLEDNKYALLYRDKELNPDPNVMSKETLTHIQELLWDIIDLADHQEKRNELGVTPLIPYIQAIENIDSMEAMTQYLINADGMNFTAEDFVNPFVNAPVESRDFYTVYIGIPTHKMLIQYPEYTNIGVESYTLYGHEKESITHVLGQMGYTDKQINNVLYNCYTFERSMSNLLPSNSEAGSNDYRNRAIKSYTLEDIEKLQKNFPLTQLLEAAGLSESETFRIFEPGFIRFMGNFYKQKNLETLKDYFLVHTILDSLPYLDEYCQTKAAEMKKLRDYFDTSAKPAPEEPEDTTDAEAMEQYRLDTLMYHYIKPLLNTPFQLAYIGNYCSSEAKQEIRNMVEKIREFYIDLFSNVEWLSQQTRDLAVEKARKMAVCIMYPDVLPDYSNLTYRTYEEGGNLLEAVAAINRRNHIPSAEKVNQAVNRADWDLDSMSTLVVNAYNAHTNNCIVILAGILAGDFMYDPNAPIEQNYGRLGTLLGHEISHSFDTTGYNFDSEGLAFGWFTEEDEVALRKRSDKLASYYSNLMYLPNNDVHYNGNKIQGEAISDMGGVKCMLALAEDIPDFNYDLFFRSFAAGWARQTTYQVENDQALEDEHPLGFFRTNVTLQQFDKFFETYGIGPGDGMYLAPEDRVLVW